MESALIFWDLKKFYRTAIDNNRLRLLWFRLWLPLRFRLWCGSWLSLCHLLFFSAILEFQFKVLAAEKGIEFPVPEFMPACAVIQIRFPWLSGFFLDRYTLPIKSNEKRVPVLNLRTDVHSGYIVDKRVTDFIFSPQFWNICINASSG